jgi:hypothetical protein
MGRSTQGVIVMKLREHDSVVAAEVVNAEDEPDEGDELNEAAEDTAETDSIENTETEQEKE